MIHPKTKGREKAGSDKRIHENYDATDIEEGWKTVGWNKKKLATYAGRHQNGQEEDEIKRRKNRRRKNDGHRRDCKPDKASNNTHTVVKTTAHDDHIQYSWNERKRKPDA